MKYVKMLALAAVAASALMAFIGAGTASATVLCSTTANPCPAGQDWPVGTEFDFSVPAGNSIILTDPSSNPIDTCKEGTVESKITNTGGSTSTTTGEFLQKEGTIAKTGLTWSGCTFPTKTLSTEGKLEVHQIAGTSNGTVTADSKIEVTINTVLLGSCIYGVTAGDSVGEITEGTGGGANPAIFHANATVEEFGNRVACPDTGTWEGTYTLTSPAGTTLSVSSS
jgi:hypothetical protein